MKAPEVVRSRGRNTTQETAAQREADEGLRGFGPRDCTANCALGPRRWSRDFCLGPKSFVCRQSRVGRGATGLTRKVVLFATETQRLRRRDRAAEVRSCRLDRDRRQRLRPAQVSRPAC